MKTLHDLADTIGYEAVDHQIGQWLDMADTDPSLDDIVIARARQLGFVKPEETLHDYGAATRQAIHMRQGHHITGGPYGWEFCGKCNTERTNGL